MVVPADASQASDRRRIHRKRDRRPVDEGRQDRGPDDDVERDRQASASHARTRDRPRRATSTAFPRSRHAEAGGGAETSRACVPPRVDVDGGESSSLGRTHELPARDAGRFAFYLPVSRSLAWIQGAEQLLEVLSRLS